MNLKKKIEDIVNFTFKNFGIYENFPIKENLLIHDNVFGTLEFSNLERKIINSPFLQRLTQIHQMGLAYFVYPGAVHTRFSHSIGVSYLSEIIYQQLMKKDNERSENQINKDINTLKLAGLLHDIGHGPFSHVSDMTIQTLRHFRDIPHSEIDSQICPISRNPDANKNLHEFLGYHIFNSERFKTFIEEIYKDVELDIDLIPFCFTGDLDPYSGLRGKYLEESRDKYKTLLIKIINGFCDADKIDYILRDSKFSGLPLPADIDRLISFFKIIKNTSNYELGVSEKGARAFHLLLISKGKMFPTVYQHHTTLACESLLQFGIINAIRNVEDVTRGLDPEKWPPIKCGVDLLFYTDRSLLDYLRIIKNPISNDVVKRLYNRTHYRSIIQLFVWELRKKLIIEEGPEFIKYLRRKNKYSELEELIRQKKSGQYEVEVKLAYHRYKKPREEKINNLFKDFDTYEKILEFKRRIIPKSIRKDIFNQLSTNLRGIDENTLIDYILKIRIAGNLPSRPIKEKYIIRINKLNNQEELLSLKDMGFLEPQHLDYQHITFFALPKFVDQLRPNVRKYLDEKLFNN